MSTENLNVVEVAKNINDSQLQIKESLKEKASFEDLKTLEKSIDSSFINLKNELSNNSKSIEKQGKFLKEIKENSQSVSSNVSVKYQINKLLKEKSDDIKALSSKSSGGIKLSLKAPVNMTFATNATGEIPQAERESGITRVQRRQPFITDLVNTGTISSNLWQWVEQKNPDGGAGMTGEGELKSKSDFDLVLAEASVKKITQFIKVSKEMLDDIPLLGSEINNELIQLIDLKKDEQILSGDGTGNNLTGILTNATPFAAGSFAATVQNANNTDVLRVAINQVMIAQFIPNYIVLHPSDAASMDLEKTTEGAYTLPPFISNEGTSIKGVPIIMNTGVTEGDFLVGDFSKSGVRMKEDVNVNIGYENEDFTKNFVTILAECRLVHRVKSNHYAAFVSGTFSTAITAIDKP